MFFWILIFLAVLQGIAEFLPISSSGHLALGTFWADIHGVFGEGAQTELSITLHAGSLLSILVFYRKRILDLLSKDRAVIQKIVVGTIPAVIVGLVVKTNYGWILESWTGAFLACPMFLITAGILLSMNRYQGGQKEYRDISYSSVLLIGCFQAFAILPGISRSGSTIFAGMFSGLRRDESATFSFLLAIPVILGATVLELKSVYQGGFSLPAYHLLTGFFVSFVVGWLSLALLVRFVNQGKLGWFAMWLIPLGIVSFVILTLQAYGILPVQLFGGLELETALSVPGINKPVL